MFYINIYLKKEEKRNGKRKTKELEIFKRKLWNASKLYHRIHFSFEKTFS